MRAFEPGLMFAGRYRLLELLGSGGMSQVWRARDQVLDRLVAVKVLSPELVRDETTRDVLRREARAMAMVSDPHVANIHDYDEYRADGEILPFVVMELVHGRTLAQALGHGPLPWPEAVRMAAQVASALAAAHEHGVIHCDVTPANVVLTRTGVKVVDFGIATVLGAGRAETRFGTMGYVAPECFDPKARITPAVDVYSLGAVLCEALAGRPLDEAEELAGLVPDLPSEVVDLCRLCLADEPSARPRARDVAAAAVGALPTVHNGPAAATGAIAVPPRPTAPLPTASLKRAGWPRLVAAAAVGLAVAALAALYLTIGRGVQFATAPELSSPSAPSSSAAARPSATPSPATPPGGVNANATANLRQAVLAGQAAGEIRSDCAQSLLDRIGDLQRRIDRGDTDNAQHRVEQIGEEINERVSEGGVTRARAASLRAALAAVTLT